MTTPGPDDLLLTDALFCRPRRVPDLAAELEVVRELSGLIATEPQAALARVADLALRLCPAGSAWLGLLETDATGESVLVWTTLAGAAAPHHGALTRDLVPGGLRFEPHGAILVARPACRFPELALIEPRIHEALIVPVPGPGQHLLGALWLLSHDEATRFCATDADVMTRFAAQMALALKVARDAAQLAQAQATRDAALLDAHHRAKNTIQAAASLLSLQASRSGSSETRDALAEAVARLGVLAGVHEFLHRSAGQQTVGLPELIGMLTDGLQQSFPEVSSHVRLRVRVDGVALDPERAVPLALLVNEAVTNAYKHAFPDGRSGEIAVRLEKTGLDGTGALTLTVRDDGIGLPTERRDGSLGLGLIQRFGAQLGGELTLSGDAGGTRIALRLPLSPS